MMRASLRLAALAAALTAIFVSPSSAADLEQGDVRHHGLHAPRTTWTGAYIGGVVGGGRATYGELEMDGVIAGAVLGYGFQRDGMYLGIEGDITGTSIEKSETVLGITASLGAPWLATLRGRIGVTPSGGPLLIYATGGVAWGASEMKLSDGFTTISWDDTMTGYVIGGGLEAMFGTRMRGRVEVLYYGFGGQKFDFLGTLYDYDADVTVVRAGLSLAFQ